MPAWSRPCWFCSLPFTLTSTSFRHSAVHSTISGCWASVAARAGIEEHTQHARRKVKCRLRSVKCPCVCFRPQCYPVCPCQKLECGLSPAALTDPQASPTALFVCPRGISLQNEHVSIATHSSERHSSGAVLNYSRSHESPCKTKVKAVKPCIRE